MVQRFQAIVGTALLIASMPVAGFAESQQEQASIRQLDLGRCIQLVNSDGDAFTVEFEAFVLCKGTKLEFERTSALLKSNPMILKTISGRIASQRGSWIWKVSYLAALEAHFNRELRRRVGDNSITGFGFMGYRITRKKISQDGRKLPVSATASL